MQCAGTPASLSARRAWIEIVVEYKKAKEKARSLSARRAWIEILFAPEARDQNAASLSARRAWIEIFVVYIISPLTVVALRKESVDRNSLHSGQSRAFALSLSARRAWIEIHAAL